MDLAIVAKQQEPVVVVANGNPTQVILSDTELNEESSTDDNKNITEVDSFVSRW